MVCIELHDKENQLVNHACRSAMLHYRSYLLHTLMTLVFSPMMLLGSKEEKQNVILELFNDYEDDQVMSDYLNHIRSNFSFVEKKSTKILM